MDKIDEEIHKKDISVDGLTRGEIYCNQRRKGSRVMYDTWLTQGLGDDREIFIAEYEIDNVIKYLTEAKEAIKIHRIKAKEAGHKV
jgi:hypothetical protein